MIPDRASAPQRPGFALAQLLACALGLCLAAASAAQDNNPGDCAVNGNGATACSGGAQDPATSLNLDWLARGATPCAPGERQCLACQGRYVDPLAGEDTSRKPELADIRAHADNTELLGNEVFLSGGVTAEQGYRRLYGDEAVIDRTEESAVLRGNVTLREPGVLITGERATLQSTSGEATVSAGQFLFHERHLRGSAELLERDGEGLVNVSEGRFTYCAPDDEDWALQSEELELDFDEGLGTARNARLDVRGVPVFYTPWLQFPLDDRRRTGFLWPNFGNDSTGGLDLTTPVYFNLAPNYDALYSPRYIEERGLNHELVMRYMHPWVGQWSVGGAWMEDDNRYRDQTPASESSDRWLGNVLQSGAFGQHWRSRIDYSKASDVDYLKDLDTTNLDAQRRTSLLQLGAIDYLGDSWLVNLEAQKFQSLADDINEGYQKLPQLTGRYRPFNTPFALEPVVVGQVSEFDSNDDNLITGQRAYGEAGATYPMRWLWGFLQPTMKYRHIYYSLTEDTTFVEDEPSVGAPLASLDGGLVFERRTGWRERGLLQTLEPRVYYLYSPYEEQDDQPNFDSAEMTFTYAQLFRETRFSGHDRLDDANRVSAGVTTSFIDEESGESLFSASIGQTYYLEDREVRLPPFDEPLEDSGSAVAGEVSFTPDRRIEMRTSWIYDFFEDQTQSGHVSAGYRADNGGLFNIGYAYRRPVTLQPGQPLTEEASISGYLPIDHNWAVYAAANYSLESERSLEDMVGVEYDSCCWTLRLLYLRYYNNETGQEFINFNDPDLEQETTVQFQIVLKGMGGFGDRITDIMGDMIRGFDERDY